LLGTVAERRSEPARAELHYRIAMEIFEGVGSGRADDLRTSLGRVVEPGVTARDQVEE